MSRYKIVQITDTHLTPENALAANNQKIDPYLKLASIFTDISQMIIKPDLIVITGDLIHEGKAKDYERLSRWITEQKEQLQIPIQVILGNHDRTKAFFEGYLKQSEQKKYYYSMSTDEYDFYFLDSKFYNYEQGYLGQEQLDWLKSNLDKNQNKHAILFLHHPVDGPAIHHMRYSILQETDELLSVISNSSVQAVFSGHIHFETSFTKNGILMHSTDSSAYHINCDDAHKHLIYDATYYDVITIDNGEIGTETKCIYEGQEVINHVNVDNTKFVDKKIFKECN